MRTAALDFLFNLAVSNAALMHQTLRWLVGSLTPSVADLDFLAATGQLPAAPGGAATDGAASAGPAGGVPNDEGGGGDDAWEPSPAALVVQDAIITTLLRVRALLGLPRDPKPYVNRLSWTGAHEGVPRFRTSCRIKYKSLWTRLFTRGRILILLFVMSFLL